MEVLLDSNFIISCIKRKIDFVSQLEEKGFKVKVPKEVLQELKDLRLKVTHDERTAIDVAFELVNARKVKKTTLGSGTIDRKLIDKGKQGIYIGSLDNEIKRSVPNRVVINSAANRVEIERS